MTKVFTMNGILRGKNLDEKTGMPVGCSIERVKEGKPVGTSRGYWKQEKKITDKAIQALADLNPGDEIQYSSCDYVIQDVWKKGTRSTGGSGGFRPGYRPDPTTELIRNLSILHESLIDKSLQWEMFCLEHDIGIEERDRSWEDVVTRTINASGDIYQVIQNRIPGGRT